MPDSDSSQSSEGDGVSIDSVLSGQGPQFLEDMVVMAGGLEKQDTGMKDLADWGDFTSRSLLRQKRLTPMLGKRITGVTRYQLSALHFRSSKTIAKRSMSSKSSSTTSGRTSIASAPTPLLSSGTTTRKTL
jgi:hypothetical protein